MFWHRDYQSYEAKHETYTAAQRIIIEQDVVVRTQN